MKGAQADHSNERESHHGILLVTTVIIFSNAPIKLWSQQHEIDKADILPSTSGSVVRVQFQQVTRQL